MSKKISEKIFIAFLLILICVGVIGICVSLFGADFVINNYNAIIDIDDTGVMTITEEIEIDYKEQKNESWRDIVVEKYNKNNPLLATSLMNDKATFVDGKVLSVVKDDIDITNKVKIGYSFNNDIDKFGDPITVPDGRDGESLYVDATGADGLVGVVRFEYQYVISGMITSYNDISELNYRIFDSLGGKVKKAKISVNLQKDTTDMDEDLFYSYGHGISKGEIIQSINDNDGLTPDYLIVGKDIKKGEYLEFRLLFPNEVVSNMLSEHKYTFDMKQKIVDYEYELYKETKAQYTAGIIINIMTFGAVGLTILLIVLAYKKYDKEYDAIFDGEYYRELPNPNRTPAEMSYLYYFGKVNDEDVTATLLDLIRKKVFVLDTNGEEISAGKPDFIITLNKDAFEKTLLKVHEKKLVKWFIEIIGDGNKVSFDEIEKYGKSYGNAQTFQKCGLEFKQSVKNEYINNDIFDKFSLRGKMAANAKGSILVVILIIMFILGAAFNILMGLNLGIVFVLILVYYIYVASIKKRNKDANEEYVKWKAFKNFLEDFGEFKDYPMPGVIVWEQYLVYATSLGIAEKVMKQLEVKLPDFNQDEATYLRTTYYGYSYSPYYYVHAFNTTMNNARMNAVSTITAHNQSSSLKGSGRGGGFTGGSSFGGGGGGFRSR